MMIDPDQQVLYAPARQRIFMNSSGTEKLSQCRSLADFEIYLDGLAPTIGFWSGRKFVHAEANESVTMNAITARFQDIARRAKREDDISPDDVEAAYAKIRELDHLGYEMIQRAPWYVRICIWLHRLGNIRFLFSRTSAQERAKNLFLERIGIDQPHIQLRDLSKGIREALAGFISRDRIAEELANSPQELVVRSTIQQENTKRQEKISNDLLKLYDLSMPEGGERDKASAWISLGEAIAETAPETRALFCTKFIASGRADGRSLRVMTRTLRADETHLFNTVEDLRFVAHAWAAHGSEQHKPLFEALEKALSSPLKPNDERVLGLLSSDPPPTILTAFAKLDQNLKAVLWIIVRPTENPGQVQYTILSPDEGERGAIRSETINRADLPSLLQALPNPQSDLSSEKIMSRTIRLLLGEAFPLAEVQEEHSLLKKWLEAHPQWASSHTQSRECKSLLIHLQTQMEKLPPNSRDQSVQQTIYETEEKLQRLEETPKAPIFSPLRQGIRQPVHIQQSKATKSEVSTAKTILDPLPPFDGRDSNVSQQILRRRRDQITTLLTEGQFEIAGRAAIEALELFRNAEVRQAYVRGIPDFEEEETLKILLDLSLSIVKANFGLVRVPFPHRHILALLRNFALILDIVEKRLVTPGETNPFDMLSLRKGLKDLYLDLGTLGGEVLDICDHLGIPENPYRARQHYFKVSTEAFPRLYLPGTKKTMEGVGNYFSGPARGLLPKETFAQRALGLLQMALFPHLLSCKEDASRGGYCEPLIPRRRLDPRELKRLGERACEKLSLSAGNPNDTEWSSSLPISTVAEPIGQTGCQFERPDTTYDLLMDEYLEETKESLSFFARQNLVADPAVRTGIAEAVVSHMANGSWGGGSEYGELDEKAHVDSRRQIHTGSRQTPFQIHTGVIDDEAKPTSVDVKTFKDLQLMQTTPPLRVESTVLQFARHPNLLTNPDFQRIFSLNLFRFGYLYQKLKYQPSFANSLFFHLGIIVKQLKENDPRLPFMVNLLARVAETMRSVNGLNLTEEYANLCRMRDQMTAQLEAQLSRLGARFTVRQQESCRQWLLSLSYKPVEEMDEEQKVRFLQRYLLMTKVPRSPLHDDEMDTIGAKADQLSPWVKEHPELLPALMRLRQAELPRGGTWSPCDGGGRVWQNETFRLNLQTGIIEEVDRPKRALPPKAASYLRRFFSREELDAQYETGGYRVDDHPYASISLEKIFDGQPQKFTVLFQPSAQANEPIIFMNFRGNEFQLQTKPWEDPETSPHSLRNFQCWASSDTILFFDDTGAMQAHGTLKSGNSITELWIKDARGYEWMAAGRHEKAAQGFDSLDRPHTIDVLVSEDKRRIQYSDLALSYDWDKDRKRWDCSLHPGYFLSPTPKPLPHLLAPGEEGLRPAMFASGFTEYHLLRNDDSSKPTLLLLSGRKYHPGADPLQKHARLSSAQDVDPVFNTPFTFELNEEQGLCSKEPAAYLYLSYVYYTQEKYAQAALAMRQAFQRLQGLTPKAAKTIEFFQAWPDKSPEATALKAQLSLYEVEQRQAEAVAASQAVLQDKSLERTLQDYVAYKDIQETVDRQLHLTPSMEKKFQFLARRSPTWIREQCTKSGVSISQWAQLFKDPQLKAAAEAGDDARVWELLQKEGTREIGRFKAALERCYIDVRDVAFYGENDLFEKDLQNLSSADQELLLRWGLDREIERRAATLPPCHRREVGDLKSLLSQPSSQEIIEGVPTIVEKNFPFDKRLADRVDQFSAALRGLFPAESYEGQLAREYSDDLIAYSKGAEARPSAQPIAIDLKDKEFRSAVDRSLSQQRTTAQKKIEQLQHEIINLFTLDPKEPSEILLRRLKEQDPVVVDLFRQGRWCFGEGDWHELIERGIIAEADIPGLEGLYRQYLQAHIKRTWIEKSQALLAEVERSDSESAREKLASALLEKRRFNPMHELAPAMLLLEDELGIILTERQVKHYYDMVTHRSSFKHELWGGGKTSVLRHLITKFHASEGYASSLLTHAPLIEKHHEQLKESTAAFYGQQALRTDFSRESPDDALAIRREHIAWLRVIEERGRTDQTLASMISRRHDHILKAIQLSRLPEEQWPEPFDKTQASGRLLQLIRDRAIIGSDELDELFSPDREHNYATGAATRMPREVYEPALEAMEWIATEPQYQGFRDAITENRMNELTDAQRKEFIDRLAQEFIAKRGWNIEGLDEYLIAPTASTELTSLGPLMNVHEAVKGTSAAAYIQSVRVFLSTILPMTFSERIGVRFGRSADGVHTKPYTNSGECNERAQHGSAHITAWYTCLDYLKNGLRSDEAGAAAVESYVRFLITQAEEENTPIDESKPGQEFLTLYGKNLSGYAGRESIDKTESSELIDQINGAIKRKIHFLRKANFEQTQVYSHRLRGNGKQVGHDVQEIWGSSGNAARVRTLPKKVALHEDLIHQTGTDGSIFFKMLTDFHKGDLLPFSREPDAYLQRLAPGSAFVDSSAFFAGMKPEEIVEKIAAIHAGTPIRFTSSKGMICVRLPEGITIPDDGSISPREMITLYSHKDRRGSDMVLQPTSPHIMTVGANTAFVDFSQGGMRVRKWGKGQKFCYAVDRRLEERIQAAPQGALSPLLTISRSLIENQAAELRRLHSMATQQEIFSIVDAAVQTIMRSAPDEQTLNTRTVACLGLLEQSSQPDLPTLSLPGGPEEPIAYFTAVIRQQQELVRRLKGKLGGDHLCQEVLDQAIADLSSFTLMPPAMLAPMTASMGQESVDIVETEVQQQVQAEQQTEVEQEAEQVVEQEQSTMIEHEKLSSATTARARKRPTNGRDCFVAGLNIANPRSVLKEYIFICDSGTAPFSSPLWASKEYEGEPFAPSVLLSIDPSRPCTDQNAVRAYIGGYKTADCLFEQIVSWPQVFTESGKRLIQTHLGDETDVELFHMQQGGRVFLHYQLYDQRPIDEALEPLLRNVNEKDRLVLREVLLKKIVAAKFAVMKGTPLSEQEKRIAFVQLKQTDKESLLEYGKKEHCIDDPLFRSFEVVDSPSAPRRKRVV